jgi:GNAT superfamily N-acetyltransferase
MIDLTVKEATHANWLDLEHLFEERGGPKSCWCMVWRARGAETKQTRGSARKGALKQRVDARIPIGLIGYVGDKPIAWCSIAPRSTYRNLGGPVGSDDAVGYIWSLVCFFVKRDFRGQDVSRHLIRAAVAHARKKGARVVESYPVDPNSPSYRFMGYVPVFEAEGFHEVGTAGSRRRVMRINLHTDASSV